MGCIYIYTYIYVCVHCDGILYYFMFLLVYERVKFYFVLFYISIGTKMYRILFLFFFFFLIFYSRLELIQCDYEG